MYESEVDVSGGGLRGRNSDGGQFRVITRMGRIGLRRSEGGAAMKRSLSHFRNVGYGSTYKCHVCGRRTRYTGGEAGNCLECYEIAGLDNMVNDNGYEPGSKEYADARAECDTLLAKAVKLGGDGERIKSLNEYIWRES
jgi:hypothetical protein